MDYAIQIHDAHKHFGRVEALRGLTLNIERGITYGLLGPNGAGKTTLIRAIMGLVRLNDGVITVLGERVPNKRLMSRMGYMTQSVALYDDLTVRQNVAFFASMAGVNGRRNQAIAEAIELVDLTERTDSRIRELSGGMQRRVSLACALVHQPEIVVLDEPTVGVDPQLRVQFWEHFHRLNEQGITLVVSSHVMDEAERCTRLGFVRSGVILAEGNAAELLQRAGTPTLEDAFLTFAKQNPAATQAS